MLNLRDHRICVTGGNGFLGRNVCNVLLERGCEDVIVPRSRVYDLRSQESAKRLLAGLHPDIVIHLAASVGGIQANQKHPGSFFYDNAMMGMNLIEQSRIFGVRKFVMVGTVCSYPKFCQTPFVETDLWNGYPEETNAPYGISKKMLGEMLRGYETEYGLQSAYVLPANLYGPGDDFSDEKSHVIPALIKRFDKAARLDVGEVKCWGTGKASREFLHVRDAAEGIVRAAEHLERPIPLNLGTGQEITICELAETISDLCGYQGRITWDDSKPDGQPKRRLDVTQADEILGWSAEIPLDTGLRETVDWWRNQD